MESFMAKTQLKSFADLGVYTPPARTPIAQIRSQEGARAWLDTQLKRGRSEIFSIKQTLTEALARELLSPDRNPDNRTVQKGTVNIYKKAMVAGHFDSLNGESIHVSVEGLLNDGQHRLEVRLLAGIELPFLFTFGVSRSARRTIDQGRNRTAKDFLTMNGYAEGAAIASVALMLWQWRLKQKVSIHSDERIGVSEIAEYAENHYQQISSSVRLIPRAGSASTGGLPVLAFMHLICAEKDLETATDFFTRLVNGNDLPKDSAILALSVRLRRRERLSRAERVELMLRAWNAHREKRSMTVIPIHRQFPLPI
jgi:hypothetical protein